MGQYLFFLLILACPLLMMFMMRGGHGHGGHAHTHGSPGVAESSSLDELRGRRDDLDREIAAREGPKEADHDRPAARV
jgi:hypothetical protein